MNMTNITYNNTTLLATITRRAGKRIIARDEYGVERAFVVRPNGRWIEAGSDDFTGARLNLS